MADDKVLRDPSPQWGYDARDEPGKRPEDKIPPLSQPPSADDNRGHRAGVTAAGEVIGSGASAGGKGGPEDFDGDPQAGGGTFEVRHDEAKPNKGGDASQHNST